MQRGLQTIPLTSPGMPPPGPDFVALARMLCDEDDEECVKQKLQWLYDFALYNNSFQLNVLAKGSLTAVKFIPGHVWGAQYATGPLGKAKVMVISKAPAEAEMRASRNLNGDAGKLLATTCDKVGLTDSEDWYVTNILRFPNPTIQQSSTIQKSWLKDCKPLLFMELMIVQPDYILCLGSEAAKELLGQQGAIKNSTGRVFDYEFALPDGTIHKSKLMTCIHPGAVTHNPDQLPQMESSLNLFYQLINDASVGSIETDIDHRVATTEEEAEAALNFMIEETKNGGAIAIDAEWQGEYPQEPGSWLRTIQVSHKPKFALCLVLHECGGVPCLINSAKTKALLNKLYECTEGRHIRAVGHFYRADLPWLLQYGLDLTKQFEVPVDPATGWVRTKTEGGFDTGTAAHAVCETDDYKLEVLATRYTGCHRYDVDLQQAKKDLCAKLKIGMDDLPGYGDIPSRILHTYANYDVDVTRRLFDVYNGVGDKPGLLDCDINGNNCRMPFWVTMRASPACAEMEAEGVMIDMERAESLLNTYRIACNRKINELKELVKWPTFNLNSPFDCRELLFGPELRRQLDKKTGKPKSAAPEGAVTLRLQPIKATGKDNKQSWEELEARGKAATRSPSSDRETLGILFHQTEAGTIENDVIVLMRDIRFLGQMLKTTLAPPANDGVNDIVDEDGEKSYEKGLLSYKCSDNRIRTHVFQNLETGRYASARPNLTNISKRREADYKRILGTNYQAPVRSIFVAKPGYVLLESDFVGAELAGMSWMSGDAGLLEHVRRTQLPEDHPDYYDIHSNIAVSAFRLDCAPNKKGLASINKTQIRVASKNVIFGLFYSRSAKMIARQAKEEGVDITTREAEIIIETILNTYPTLPAFFQKCRARVHDEKWMCNCFGRFRRFGNALNSKVEGELERQALNFGIQSLVADGMSRGLDFLYNWPNRTFKILLQIHDAVLLEVPICDIEYVYDIVIPECLINRLQIYPTDLNGIPLAGVGPYRMGVDSAVAIRWGEKLEKDIALKLGIPVRFAS